MAIRAVLWDVDDTIFDYAGSDRTGLLRHLRAEGLADSDEDHHGRWMRIASVHWARVAAGSPTGTRTAGTGSGSSWTRS